MKVKEVSLISDYEQFLLAKLTQNPPVITIVSCGVLFLFFLLPLSAVGGF